MKRLTILSLALALVGVGSSTSLADDSESSPAPFEPLEQFGRIGIGMVRRGDATGMDSRYGFDGTVRFGKVWHATDLVRPGFFFELRTVNFETFEPAIGPQTQFRISKTLAIQLRTGVGAEANGRSFALGSVAVGNAWLGGSVTARRMFGDETQRETVISANLEISGIVMLFPVAILYALGSGGPAGP